VLDVGCGSGATTLAAAATAERAVGVDLSQPLVELARRRARAAKIANAEFVIADAQTHDFAAGTFDLLISQFGMMFFDDPVPAFTNLRRSLRAGGRAAFVSWQGLRANEWLMLIADAVRRHAELPEFGGQARGPGMFALCEPGEIVMLLGAAGYDQVKCDSYAPTIVVGGGGSLSDSIDFLLDNPMPRGLLGLVGPSARDEVLRTVRAELVDRYEEDVGIRLGAAVWMVTAQA
jgi:SAM-dependent methyltransferase